MNPVKSAAELSIFIVEDDPKLRDTLIDVLSLRRGVTASGAGSAAEALAALKLARPSVIILDVQLPDSNGIDLCRRIKRIDAFEDTPVILVSASAKYNDSRDRVEGLMAGAKLFLSKPISPDRLWAEIDELFKTS